MKNEIESILIRLNIIETKEVSEFCPVVEFKCEECDYIASTKTVLKRHNTMKHKKTGFDNDSAMLVLDLFDIF